MRFKVLVALATLAFWVVSAGAKERMYCYRNILESYTTGGGRIQLNGFTVEVKPGPDQDDSSLTFCRATVRFPKGKTVFEYEDWGIEIDPVTGRDVNGDGFPDAVFMSFSGGAHCCSTYHIISLGKRPGLIAKFEKHASASFRDLRGDGRIEIVIRDGTFDFGFGMSHVFSVFPLLIVQLQGSSFQDASSSFRDLYLKEIQKERGKLKSGSLREFRQSHASDFNDSQNYEEVEYSVLLIALDYLYDQQTADAHHVLDELWPAESEERTWQEMLRGYCSGLRSGLGLNSQPPCEDR